MEVDNILIPFRAKTNMPKLAPSLVLVFILTGCSSVSIDGAKSLATTGRSVAVQTQQNIFISDNEYLRARDGEILLHGDGTVGSDMYIILELYNDIHQELAQRAVVFEKLADTYDAFGDLASLDEYNDTEMALGNFAGAINEYAKAAKQTPPISSDITGIISNVGGLIAEEVQKNRIKEASSQIRKDLGAFVKLLENPLVREQMEGFNRFLASDRKSAIVMLWNLGVYDPTPLLNELGADAALTTQKDVVKLVMSNPSLTKALGEVIDKRLAYKNDLIEQAYDLSLVAIKRLISEHEKLEKGSALDLARLREMVSKLRGIAVMLSKQKPIASANQ